MQSGSYAKLGLAFLSYMATGNMWQGFLSNIYKIELDTRTRIDLLLYRRL